jgi:hypothetical protein
LGRGFHITADEFSIVSSLSLQEHIVNCITVAFTDPLFIVNIVLATILVKLHSKDLRSAVICILIGVYFIFYVLMVVSTGGLASARYVFPVTLALLVTQLITLFGRVDLSIFAASKRSTITTKAGWVVGVMTCLVLARITVGPGVIEKRLKMYEPTHAVMSSIDKIQQIANRGGGAKGAALLMGTGYERFIVSKLKGAYFIMDTAGMLSPWRRLGLGYADGLSKFLIDQNVKTIVMNKPNCETTKRETYSGWPGAMQLGYLRNEHAICRLMPEFVAETVGPFLVLTRRVNQAE